MKIDDSERGGGKENDHCSALSISAVVLLPTPHFRFPSAPPRTPPKKIKEKGGNVRYNRSPVPPAEKKGTSGKVYQK